MRAKLPCNSLLWSLSFISILVLDFQARMEMTRVEPFMQLHSIGRVLAFSSNIRLCLKWILIANTLAYCEFAKLTDVKNMLHRPKCHLVRYDVKWEKNIKATKGCYILGLGHFNNQQFGWLAIWLRGLVGKVTWVSPMSF
jgi:hypothetical protein